MVLSPNFSRSITARRERPIRRCISLVLPPILPLEDSLTVLLWVERGNREYSAVNQPVFCPRKKGGTFSSTDTLHKTFVSPISMKTEPSAYLVKFLVIFIGRSSLCFRLSTRNSAINHAHLSIYPAISLPILIYVISRK